MNRRDIEKVLNRYWTTDFCGSTESDTINKDDEKDLINDLFALTDVSSMFSAEQMEQAFNDGAEAEQQRCGEFDIENYC